MKKILAVTALLFVFASAAFAIDKFPLGATKNILVDATAAPTIGTEYYISGEPRGVLTWTLRITGSPTAYVVVIEGSIEGNTGSWHNMSEINNTTAVTEADGVNKMKHIALKDARFFRARLVSLTGTGTFNVHASIVR